MPGLEQTDTEIPPGNEASGAESTMTETPFGKEILLTATSSPTAALDVQVPPACDCTWAYVNLLTDIAANYLGNPAVADPNIKVELTNWGCPLDEITMLNELTGWILNAAISSGVNDEAALIKLGIDIGNQMESIDSPCLSIAKWMSIYSRQLIQRGYAISFVITESPVYPLVVSTSGMAGYSAEGQVVRNLADAEVVQIGEKRLIFFTGGNQVYILVNGYDDGMMNLHFTLSTVHNGDTLSYEEVQVTRGMLAVIEMQGELPVLRIDDNRDGKMDRNYSPQKLNLSDIDIAPTGSSALISSRMLVIIGAALFLVAVGAGLLAIWFFLRRRRTPIYAEPTSSQESIPLFLEDSPEDGDADGIG